MFCPKTEENKCVLLQKYYNTWIWIWYFNKLEIGMISIHLTQYTYFVYTSLHYKLWLIKKQNNIPI